MKNVYEILVFVLILFVVSSCTETHQVSDYRKPICKNSIEVQDSIVPLKYFIQERAVSLDAQIRAARHIKLTSAKGDSLYPLIGFTGKDTCSVHHCLLEIDTVLLSYGLVAFALPKDLEAKLATFPNVNRYVTAYSCISGPPKFAEVLFCPICRLYYKEWENYDENYYH